MGIVTPIDHYAKLGCGVYYNSALSGYLMNTLGYVASEASTTPPPSRRIWQWIQGNRWQLGGFLVLCSYFSFRVFTSLSSCILRATSLHTSCKAMSSFTCIP